MHNALFGIKDLAHLDGSLGFLIRIRQLPQALRHGADADDGLDAKLVLQRLLHALGDLFHVLGGDVTADLLDHRHVRLIDGQDKILHLVREHGGQHVHRRHITVAHLTDQEHRPGRVRGKVQLLGPDVNIAGQDVVHDNILDKGAPVVLFLIEGLGVVQGNEGHLAEASGSLIVAGAEHGVLKVVGVAHNGLEGFLRKGNDALGGVANLQRGIRPALTKHRHIGAGNHAAFRINHTEHAVGNIPQLDDNALKNTIGHLSVTP